MSNATTEMPRDPRLNAVASLKQAVRVSQIVSPFGDPRLNAVASLKLEFAGLDALELER